MSRPYLSRTLIVFNLTSSPKPSIHDPEIAPVWERYSRLRTRLYPYLAGSQEAYQRTGMPLMRHLSLVAPEDQTATAQDDEFMLGADVLAAPVVTQGATDRRVYLPEGRWVDLWRSVTFDDEGRFEIGDGSETLDGRRHVDVPAPVSARAWEGSECVAHLYVAAVDDDRGPWCREFVQGDP